MRSQHEQKISGKINDLMNLALDERDHPSASFSEWVRDEQVEEESTRTDRQQLKLIGDLVQPCLMDRELGTRTLAPAGAEEA